MGAFVGVVEGAGVGVKVGEKIGRRLRASEGTSVGVSVFVSCPQTVATSNKTNSHKAGYSGGTAAGTIRLHPFIKRRKAVSWHGDCGAKYAVEEKGKERRRGGSAKYTCTNIFREREKERKEKYRRCVLSLSSFSLSFLLS